MQGPGESEWESKLKSHLLQWRVKGQEKRKSKFQIQPKPKPHAMGRSESKKESCSPPEFLDCG
jgi:hypothetical protein